MTFGADGAKEPARVSYRSALISIGLERDWAV